MIQAKEVHVFKVHCPYCTVGYTSVDVSKYDGAQSVDTNPRQCSHCDRYFRLGVRMRLQGMRLENVDREVTFRNSLVKEIVENGC